MRFTNKVRKFQDIRATRTINDVVHSILSLYGHPKINPFWVCEWYVSKQNGDPIEWRISPASFGPSIYLDNASLNYCDCCDRINVTIIKVLKSGFILLRSSKFTQIWFILYLHGVFS